MNQRVGTGSLWVAACASTLLLACSKSDVGERRGHRSAAPDAPSAVEVTHSAKPTPTVGDPKRGKVLTEQFECHRCHDGTGIAAMPREKHCTTCHEEILTGKFPAAKTKLAAWRPHVAPYRDIPTLEAVGRLFTREWLERYLMQPEDLRPHLTQTMPRLALTETDARDVAAYLTTGVKRASAKLERGDAARGRKLFEAKACGTCHEFSGAPAGATTPNPAIGDESQKRAVALAPDLRFARERVRPAAMLDWLLDPTSIRPSTRMPSHNLQRSDAEDLVAYLTKQDLTPQKRAVPTRLPVLERRVGYEEVRDQVFGVTCHHCHLDPKSTGGDGGPGNTGGFGFPPRKLDLSSYRAIASGFVAADGERHSVFEKLSDGSPRLIAALWARHSEVAGEPNPEIRGMPLGLPPLDPADIQLVETWVAQGRPR